MKPLLPHLILVLAVLSMCCCTGNTSHQRMNPMSNNPDNAATVLVDDSTVEGLVIYYPQFSRIDLVCGTMPSQQDTTVIYCAEAAFTHELLDSVAAAGGMGFGQAIIIHGGESIRPLWRDNLGTNKVTHYRALCEKDGQLCIADSRDEVDYATFVDLLEAFEPRHALYLDMGSGWNHSWWRDQHGKVHEIHPIADKSRYCTNWITFYN